VAIQTTKPLRESSNTGFFCPMCGRAVTPGMRLSYPPQAVGHFAPVYRCGCGRHIGEPVVLATTKSRQR
jgi:hypothetical protein